MKLNSSFIRLTIMELEAYWNFPILELVLFTALLSILNRPSPFDAGYYQLNQGFYGLGVLLQMLIIGIIIPRTFAGSISSRQVMVLLSYPTKRWAILVSKLFTNLIVLTATLSIGIMINSLLLGSGPLEGAVYILVAVVAVQVLFWCAISVFLSVTIKNEAVSVFAFLLLMLGLEFNPLATSGAYANLTQLRSNMVMYNYLTSMFHGTTSIYTNGDFTTAIGFPLVISLILIALSIAYFEKVLQVD